MKTFFAPFNYIELELTEEVVNLICHSGDNTEDVKRCLELPEIAEQINKLDPKKIATELKEYGAWDDNELQNEQDNKERILWVGAWNIFDESDFNEI